MIEPTVKPPILGVVWSLALASTPHGAPLRAQVTDSLATLRLRVLHDSTAVAGARVTAGGLAVVTGAGGTAVLRLPPGPATLVTTRIGFLPDTVRLTLRSAQDTAVVVRLEPSAVELEAIVVTATRSERRVEDTPLRVEVVDEEEVAEKASMTPGDIAMMLNETSGLRLQTTSPSLGGANVRVQGLSGRYTLLLADGLPLYGGQAGGLGLLQIPPLDLARAEVIKGAASALYGSSALGGVVNLVSRRPGVNPEGQLLLNQTTRAGTDGALFWSSPLGPPGTPYGATLLVSGHRQRENDLDQDGWADMPGYQRLVVRPRVFYATPGGRSVFATGGYTAEDRHGGTLEGRVAPDGVPYPEGLRTHRWDAGAVARLPLSPRNAVSLRGSAMEQRHRHQFGPVIEDDVHRTWFTEASVVIPAGAGTFVLGAALQEERYSSRQLPGFDYRFRIPAAFAQADLDLTSWLVVSASGRADWHSEYGATLSPRLSLLLRTGRGTAGGWTARVSGGGGAFTPVPFTEETEVTGLTPVRPLQGLVTERAAGGSLDLNGVVETPLGNVELNATLFGARVRHALAAVADTGSTVNGAGYLTLANAPEDTRTGGVELLARWRRGVARLTASYAYVRATEWDPEAGGVVRRAVPLVPRHAAGVVASLEQEGVSRLGIELYYTGRQALEDTPYRSASEPYVILGLLVERVVATSFGRARLFLNAENLTNVRQTRFDPLSLPNRGIGGRWTTDVWTELAGRVVNGGVRWSF